MRSCPARLRKVWRGGVLSGWVMSGSAGWAEVEHGFVLQGKVLFGEVLIGVVGHSGVQYCLVL